MSHGPAQPTAGDPPGSPALCRLTVVRGPADGLGDQYPISLRLDGAPLGDLGPGESVEREIAPGRHLLRASNTLMRKAVELELRPGERVRFATRNRAGLGTTLFGALGAGWFYVALEREMATAGSGGDGSAAPEVELGGDARI